MIVNNGNLFAEFTNQPAIWSISSISANITINGGKLTQNIGVGSSGNLLITGGEISGNTDDLIEIQSGSTAIIEGGKINLYTDNNKYASIQGISNSGRLTIKGGDISASAISNATAIMNYGELTIEGGNITAGIVADNTSYQSAIGIRGKCTITGGNITASTAGNKSGDKSYGINGGPITMTGGTVSSTNSGESYGIYGSGETTIQGGTISAFTKSGSSYGINNNTSITIEKGNISASAEGKLSSAIGVSGKAVIGKNDEVIDNTEISITGKTYGVSGDIKYYDGIITGGTVAINATVSEIAGDVTLTESEQGKQLELKAKETGIAYIEETFYDDLQTAINECEEETITLVKDITETDILTIETGKKVTLNLNGNKITTLTNDIAINNKGEFTLKDEPQERDNEEGMICGFAQKGIQNEGTLKIEGGSICLNSTNSTYGIYNVGEHNLTIQGDAKFRTNYGIYNEEEATLTIDEGEIYSENYGVYNETNGVFNFNNGEIIAEEGKEICGEVSELQEGHNIVKYKHEENEDHAVEEGKEIIVLENINIASTNNKEYASLSQAIQETTEGKITILSNIAITEAIVISADKNITLDLAGHEITYLNSIPITNNGTLHIEDSTGEAIILSNKSNLILNNEQASLNIDNVTLKSTICAKVIENKGTLELRETNINLENDINGTYEQKCNLYGIYNLNAGTVTIEDVNIIANTTGKYTYIYGIYNESTGNVGIQGGSILLTATGDSSQCYGIYNKETGDITIESIDITLNAFNTYSNSYGIYNSKEGNITVENSSIITSSSRYAYGIYNSEAGNVTIQEVNISSSTTDDFVSAYGIYNGGEGNITIKDGEISATSKYEGTGKLGVGSAGSGAYGIYNSNSGIITIEKGSITATKNDPLSTEYAYGIYNSNTGSIVLGKEGESTGTTEDINITGEYGIYNRESGPINVNYGTISSTKSGIYCKTNSEVVIGEKDGQVDNSKIDITGEEYGIYGTIKYYEGLITGKTEPVQGTISEIENEAYILVKQGEEGEQFELEKQEGIAYVGNDEEILYKDLRTAIEACEEEGTITLVKNALIEETLTVEEGKKITLNLNGNDIKSLVSETAIINKGELTLKDETENETGKIYGKFQKGIQNEGILEISNVGIDIKNDLNSDIYGIYSKGETKILGGNICISSEYSGYGSSKKYGIYSEDTGKINIEGGNIDLKINSSNGSIESYGIYNVGTGEIIIEEASISSIVNATSSSKSYGINNQGGGDITLKGGTISSYVSIPTYMYYDGYSYGIYNEAQGDITIERGNISAFSDAHYNYGYGIYSKDACQITLGTERENANNDDINIEGNCGIYNSSNGNIIMKYGTISATGEINNKKDNYGIYNDSGNLEIIRGNINSTNDTAIYNNNGTLTIGNNEDNEVDVTTPSISGEANGVYTGGTFNFYDGIIKGNSGAISTSTEILTIPEGYEIQYTDITKTAKLRTIEEGYYLILAQGTYYNSLETAIGVISNTTNREGTIHIRENIQTDKQIEIPEGVDITIALEGHQITYTDTETAIINNGTLRIIDYENVEVGSSTTVSKIQNQNGTVIQNNGTLIIGQEGNANRESPVIEGTQAVKGEPADVKSGKLVGGTEGILAGNRVRILALNNEGIELSIAPEMSYKPTEWTRNNARAYMEADIIPILELYSKPEGLIETGKVTVRYVDQDTEKDIAIDESSGYGYEITGNVGEEYETQQKEIPYYVYVRSTENTKGTINKGEDTVIYYYRKQVFNFSIEKTLAGVTLNGQAVKIKDNKLAKIELKSSEIENTSVVADYKIKVTNEGELEGTAKVVDKLPEGYKGLIVPDYWKENGNGTLEAEVELGAGESKELTITLIWENSEENLGPKSNKAELVEGENLANYEDTNKEDNTSEATIVISIKTGEVVSIIIITLMMTIIITGAVILIITKGFGKQPYIKNIKFLNK